MEKSPEIRGTLFFHWFLTDQLLNTINYIRNNRKKHGLPNNPALQNLIGKTN